MLVFFFLGCALLFAFGSAGSPCFARRLCSWLLSQESSTRFCSSKNSTFDFFHGTCLREIQVFVTLRSRSCDNTFRYVQVHSPKALAMQSDFIPPNNSRQTATLPAVCGLTVLSDFSDFIHPSCSTCIVNLPADCNTPTPCHCASHPQVPFPSRATQTTCHNL